MIQALPPRRNRSSAWWRPSRTGRVGSTVLLVVAAVAAVAVLAAVLLGVFWLRSAAAENTEVMVHVVERGPFRHTVVERGEVESADNVEIRCEVRARKGGNMTLLWVVPEGTRVQAGEVVARLDSSALEVDLVSQQITVNKAQASVIEARNRYEAALIAKREYLEGTYRQQEQSLEGDLFVAEENLRRAEQYARYSERLAAKGYVTELQLVGDRFAVEKARKDRDAARTRLHVLQEYTREKELKKLDSDIVTTEANWQAQQRTFELEQDTLREIEELIAKCEIRAPQSGQVVYANQYSSRGGTAEFVVEAGAQVREGQVILRLPDPRNMQVKAKVNESRIERVRPGMVATIRLDAFPDVRLHGEVVRVNEYPEPANWWASYIREYATIVRILDPPEGLNIKPGLTAEVNLHVKQVDDVLQVPVQSVYQHGDELYCLVQKDRGWEARAVKLGPTNEKFVIVEEGLNVGDTVTMNPRRYLDQVTLPDLPRRTMQSSEALAARGGPSSDADAGAVFPGGRPAAGDLAGAGGEGPRLRRTAAGSGGGPREGAAGGGREGGPREGGPREGGPREGAAGMGRGGAGTGSPGAMAAAILSQLDRNGDGRLSADEIPADRRDRLMAADANGDGVIDLAELTAAMQRLAAAMGGGGPRPPADGQ